MSRWVSVAAGVALVAVAGGYTWVSAFEEPDGFSLDYAEHWDGREVVLPLVQVMEVRDRGTYVVARSLSRVAVRGDTTGLAVGQFVTLSGTFHAQDVVIDELWRKPHPLRWAKLWIGAVGTVVLGSMLPLWFRVRRDGIEGRCRTS